MSETAAESAPRKLPLRRVLVGAFALPWKNRIAVLRAAGLPLLVTCALILWGDVGDWGNLGDFGIAICATVALSWLAVTMHRLLLAHSWHPLPVLQELRLVRLLRFLGVFLLIGIVWCVVYFGLLELFWSALDCTSDLTDASGNAKSARDWLSENARWVEKFVSAIAYCATARLSLVLPAIALDHKANYVAAWRITRGNGWRVVIAVGALPWFLDSMTPLLWRDGATEFEIGGLAILTGVVAIVEVVALSLTYSELTRASAPPPTHPPG